jgi:hypothetical protein
MDRKSQMLHLAEQWSELEDDKKKRETYHLLLFLESFEGFPAGAILPCEHPDFLVQTSQGYIGIELTEYYRDSGNKYGSPLRAKETHEEMVLKRASSGYKQRGLPPVHVGIHWSPSNHLIASKIDQLAATLIDLVECHLPEQDSTEIIGYLHPGHELLPDEVLSLHILRTRNLTQTTWVPFGAIFPPELTGPNLQDLVDKKEDKVSTYRQTCSQVWLLIVSNHLELPMIRWSKICELAPETKDHRLETTFDRVFFLDCLDRYVVELGTGVGT